MARIIGFVVALGLLAAPPALVRAAPAYNSQFIDQSAFALGTFRLNVVLLESNGTIDPSTENWTPAQIDNLHREIDEAVAFWEGFTAGYHPNARLQFDLNYTNGGQPVPTGYEPITRSSGNDSLWIRQAMSFLGYNQASHFDSIRAFNHDQRLGSGANWSATMFVVNDEVDADNRFSNSQFAYAHIGGPFAVYTYGNNGWDINRFNHVMSHETAHLFFALDEYFETGERNTNRSGYLNGINGNAERNGQGQRVTPPQPNALMINNTLIPSPFTLVHMGIQDTDADGVPDILDVPPALVGDDTASDPTLGVFRFTGTAETVALPNLNQKNVGFSNSQTDMTINWIAGAQYALDGQPWTDIPAVDGTYEGYTESIALTLPGLSPGLHTIELRAINSVDISSSTLTFQFESMPIPEPSSMVLALAAIGLAAFLRQNR
jgi:hypothetical protein